MGYLVVIVKTGDKYNVFLNWYFVVFVLIAIASASQADGLDPRERHHGNLLLQFLVRTISPQHVCKKNTKNV